MFKKEKDKTSVNTNEMKQSQKTICMERSAEDAKGGPLTAEVHPDEVVNFEKTGWKKAK